MNNKTEYDRTRKVVTTIYLDLEVKEYIEKNMINLSQIINDFLKTNFSIGNKGVHLVKKKQDDEELVNIKKCWKCQKIFTDMLIAKKISSNYYVCASCFHNITVQDMKEMNALEETKH